MKNRIIASILCLVMLFALVPATANAEVLPGMTSKVDYENTDPYRYSIEIDLANQIITVYEGGSVVLQSLCTTGNSTYPTGSGTFRIGDLKERFGYFVAFGQHAQYWTQVVRGVYIHSIMYNSKKLSTLSSSAYRNLGKNVSHGCIRVLPDIAEWIFYNCPPGTTCKVVKNRPANPALVKSLRAAMKSYTYYTTYTDKKAYPVEIPASVLCDNVPVRTGFSASRDKTVAKLNANDNVMLLQLGADWCKVRTMDGTLGYVMSSYLLCYPDAGVETRKAYAATRKTYVYESASTSAKQIATIGKDAQMTVTGNPQKGWYSVSFNGVTGFARTKYVKLSNAVVFPTLPGYDTYDPSIPYNPDVAPSIMSARVRSDINANMRSGAGTAFDIVATIGPDTPVTIKSISGSWYYIEADGYTGYVHASCILK
ncbi:MAG: SH3 domain-containing protein [Clostridia bacterium]